MERCIALIGLSGSGKSTVGKQLAQRLGWRFVDTDTMVAESVGLSVSEIFAEHGEEAFREWEQTALDHACQPRTVVATGGGIVEHMVNRALLRERAHTVWLHAQPAVLAQRLQDATDRPLLGSDPLGRLQLLAERRTVHYAALADWVVATDQLAPAEVLGETERAFTRLRQSADLHVNLPGGSYPIVIGAGVVQELGRYLKQLGLARQVWLVGDDTVLPLYGERVQYGLHVAGIPVATYAIPAGEAHKTMATVRTVHDWLLTEGVERGDVLVALGGGVVGDLAGFAAATVLRGIAVVQLPTTVLAMVDSSIGGKTGVDHAVGKNLIGAFHQPRLVLADTVWLASLPLAERRAGWVEAIKHGMIGDPQLFHDLAAHVTDLDALHDPILGDLLRRAALFKARIVGGDEREAGQRILLNYGHTIGHALEAWSNFHIRHGEAVAIGMCAAATIAQHLGMVSNDVVDEQRRVLQAFGLPTTIPADADLDGLLRRTGSDKKVHNRRVQWVLPTAIGAMTVRRDVPDEVVLVVLSELQEAK